ELILLRVGQLVGVLLPLALGDRVLMAVPDAGAKAGDAAEDRAGDGPDATEDRAHRGARLGSVQGVTPDAHAIVPVVAVVEHVHLPSAWPLYTGGGRVLPWMGYGPRPLTTNSE